MNKKLILLMVAATSLTACHSTKIKIKKDDHSRTYIYQLDAKPFQGKNNEPFYDSISWNQKKGYYYELNRPQLTVEQHYNRMNPEMMSREDLINNYSPYPYAYRR